jgi:hypothetical protein
MEWKNKMEPKETIKKVVSGELERDQKEFQELEYS